MKLSPFVNIALLLRNNLLILLKVKRLVILSYFYPDLLLLLKIVEIQSSEYLKISITA